MLSSFRFWLLFIRSDILGFSDAIYGRKSGGRGTISSLVGGIGIIFLMLTGFAPILLLIPAIVLLSGTYMGVRFAISIADSIAMQHEKRRYESLSAAPLGREGVHWFACLKAKQYHNRMYDFSTSLFLIYFGIGAPGFCFLGVNAVAGLLNSEQSLAAITLPIVIIVPVLMLISDVVQSIFLGCAIGMFVPTVANDRLTTQLLSFVLFMLSQFAFYVVFYVLASSILDDGLSFIVILLIFYFMREMMINGFLYFLAYRLDANMESLKIAFESYAS